MNLRRRTTCRVCGSPHLETVIDLGPQWLQGSFVKPGMPLPPQRQIPCELVRCCPDADENACGLLQMRHSVPPSILYSDYGYRSGTNATMRDHLAGIVNECYMLRPMKEGRVLDIGCNDGTMLKMFPDTFNRVGVDPANIERQDVMGIEIHQALFPTQLVAGRLFDIITSIAMFYDVENPVEFARCVKANLAQDGVWVIEVAYLPQMLKNNGYDTIVHEHLEYYSFAVLENIMRRVGLRVFRAELNGCNGGSIRCYVSYSHSTHDRPEWTAEMDKIRLAEFDLELEYAAPFLEFQGKIETAALELQTLVVGMAREGKKIHVLGASTKGNTILQFAKLDVATIEAASDRNPDKHGARTLGTDIPIVSEEESRAMKPDVYIAMPWHFADELIEREREYLLNGGTILFPLPVVRMVTKDDLFPPHGVEMEGEVLK